MNLIDRPSRLLAVALSALAGFLDAVGFLSLGGFFVSFMSGNSTRLGVGLAAGNPDALLAGALIAAFLAGVVAGALVGHRAGGRRKGAVLAAVATLLALAALLAVRAPAAWAALAIAAAMGAENTVFERDGDVPFGVTYMTGALVKVGQRLALALRGGPALAWLPYATLWLGLVLGTVAGTLAYARLGLDALWPAAGACLALALVAEFGPRFRARA